MRTEKPRHHDIFLAYWKLGRLDDIPNEEADADTLILKQKRVRRSIDNLLIFWDNLGLKEKYAKPSRSSISYWASRFHWQERVKELDKQVLARKEKELVEKFALKDSEILMVIKGIFAKYIDLLKDKEFKVTSKDLSVAWKMYYDFSGKRFDPASAFYKFGEILFNTQNTNEDEGKLQTNRERIRILFAEAERIAGTDNSQGVSQGTSSANDRAVERAG